MDELEVKFNALLEELKTYREQAEAQQAESGTMNDELKAKIDAIQGQVDALDVKIAEKHAAAVPQKSLEEKLKENDAIQQVMRTKNGNAHFELSASDLDQLWGRKTTVTESTVGAATTGVLPIERIPGITEEARQQLTIRDALTARPTSQLVVDYVKVIQTPVIASPQTEASAKAENWVGFQASSQQVQTIATWIPASRQILDDWSELMAFLKSSMSYYVDLAEEKQLLSGAGTGVNLSGLITNATSFDTNLLVAADGWNRIDIIGRAIEQIQNATELAPTFVVVHPTDWWHIRLTKDSYGRYILGDPQGAPVGRVQTGGILSGPPRIFDLMPIVTTSITSGTFLVGSGSPIAAEIRDRMGMQVEIATQHASYFTSNLIAIRAEKRLCLVVKRGASFITGSFSTSP